MNRLVLMKNTDATGLFTTPEGAVLALDPGAPDKGAFSLHRDTLAIGVWPFDTRSLPRQAFASPGLEVGRIFNALRWNYPQDLSAKNFMSYAACSVTEGPFVRLRRQGLAYFEALKQVGHVTDRASRRIIRPGPARRGGQLILLEPLGINLPS